MKICPVCNSRCFDDMQVCYGCMHRFDEPAAPPPEVSEPPERPTFAVVAPPVTPPQAAPQAVAQATPQVPPPPPAPPAEASVASSAAVQGASDVQASARDGVSVPQVAATSVAPASAPVASAPTALPLRGHAITGEGPLAGYRLEINLVPLGA